VTDKRKRILITGASGFLAAHSAALFRREGWEVAALDLREPQGLYRQILPPDVPLFLGDIMDASRLDEVLAAFHPSGIIHAAAIVGPVPARGHPSNATRVNVLGTLNVLEAARAHELRVTYLSTATLYGTRPDGRPLCEDECPNPVGIYDATKLMGETLAIAYFRTYGVDVACVRPSFVYGPGAASGEYLLPRAVRGESFDIPYGRDHPLDLTYVDDLVRGLYLAHTVRPIEHRVFNVSSGLLRTFGDLADEVRKAVPSAAISLGPGIHPDRHLRGPCDITRARVELGFEPRFDLRRGVAAWLDWLSSHGKEGKD
jgi:nucleoside-diphosphate-sugar epimerase